MRCAITRENHVAGILKGKKKKKSIFLTKAAGRIFVRINCRDYEGPLNLEKYFHCIGYWRWVRKKPDDDGTVADMCVYTSREIT